MTEDFWDWLPKAYRDGDIGDEPQFTKYNMEAAFAAGAEAEAKRMWVGLTDEERKDALVSVDAETKRLPPGFKYFAGAIEAKLKEKNHG